MILYAASAIPRPTRTREDDRLVEMFLQAYHGGRYAHAVEWLPQDQPNVECIASDKDSKRLAIEHTALFDFPVGRHANPDEDPILAEIGDQLRRMSLPVPDRLFVVSIDPAGLKKLLTKRHRAETLKALEGWACRDLPLLYEGREFTVSVPGTGLKVQLDVGVYNVRNNCPIMVSGYPAPRSEIALLVRKALNDKLPKLGRARADRRILMLEMVTMHSVSAVYETMKKLAGEFPEFLKVDEFAFAVNPFELGVAFQLWNTSSGERSTLTAQIGN